MLPIRRTMKISALLISLVLLLLPAAPAAASPGGIQPVGAALAKKPKKKCKRVHKHGRHVHRRCRKRKHAPSPVSPVTPVPTPANPDQPTSPAQPTTPVIAEATIYKINQGAVPAGTRVKLSNVLSTAHTPAHESIWVQVKPGDPGDEGWQYSALRVDVSATSASLHDGDRLTILGTTEETPAGPVLDAEAIEVLSSLNETAPPHVLSAATFIDPAKAAELNGVFVRIAEEVFVEAENGATWTMVDPSEVKFTVGDRLLPLGFPSYGYNEFEIQGIAGTLGSGELLPREGDINELGP